MLITVFGVFIVSVFAYKWGKYDGHIDGYTQGYDDGYEESSEDKASSIFTRKAQ